MNYQIKINNKVIYLYNPFIVDNLKLGFKGSNITPDICLDLKNGYLVLNKKYKIRIDRRSSDFRKLRNIYLLLKQEIINYSNRLKNNKEPLLLLYNKNSNDFLLTTKTMLEDCTGTSKFRKGLSIFLNKNGINMSIDKIEKIISKNINRKKLKEGESQLLISCDSIKRLIKGA